MKGGEIDKTLVIWISRHELKPANHEILKKAFGSYEVIQINRTLNPGDAKILVKEARNVPYRKVVFVVVLPPQLVAEFLAEGAEVYRFIVERTVDEEGRAEFFPVGLERIKEIKIETERVV